MSTITLTLPAVDVPPKRIETQAGALIVPGQRLPPLSVEIDPVQVAELVAAAREAAEQAYAPYSKFRVGAALIMADDPEQRVFTGANIENSSYGVSNCGERTALFAAAAKGFRRLKYLAVSTASGLDGPLRERSPCGICRQAFREFVPLDSDAKAALFFCDTGEEGALAEVFDIERLLPYGFTFAGPAPE